MIMKNLFFTALMLMAIIGFNTIGLAATPVESTNLVAGKVVWVRGMFKAVDINKKERMLAHSNVIYEKDTLKTDDKTQAQIVFTDGTLMTFIPNSTFYIEQYKYVPKKEKSSVGVYIMKLLTGGFRTITGLIAKSNPSDYKINTPVATIGVRGTDYAVYLKEGELYVGYYQGSPCLSNKSETICLDKITPYAKVASSDSAPVPVTQRPEGFNTKSPIVNVTFSSVDSLGPNGITTPGNVNGILNSFCIQ